jgi:tRNA dimethylallyltransferase
MDPAREIPVLALLGPTAVGKTDLALTLAERWPLDVVNMDSAQVYRGMDIGTAKPDAAARARLPHHLFDQVDPAEAYSAGRFVTDARAAIQTIQRAGRVPLLVGGTVLYYRALRDGLAPLPAADPIVRAELAARAAQVGWPALHAELADADPEAGVRIHPHDAQRIQRALEVLRLTGVPLSSHWARTTHSGLALQTLALIPADRAWLHRRIAQRLEAMFATGFVEEVARLQARGDLHADLPALRAVGYRQVWACLEGRLDEALLFQSVLQATRQFAKRQLTALRPLPGIMALQAEDRAARAQAVDYFAAVLDQSDKRG